MRKADRDNHIRDSEGFMRHGLAASPGITVLLVDDQPSVADRVEELLAGEKDITFDYCPDPGQAVGKALEVGPTVILQDLVMPTMDGLTLTRLFKAHPRLRDIPLVVLSSHEESVTKAEAFAAGADDYQVKIPDGIELVARIRYHSKAYITLLQKNHAFEALARSQEQIAAEVARAAAYVTSLLPSPISESPIAADWRFFPSTTLGGDSLGYHWVDDQHFAMYLLDASGHGIGAALLSVSALNMIRSETLPNTDFTRPHEVLDCLNRSFPMERHDNLYFTIWYGVYNRGTGRLVFAGAGHPPPLLIQEGAEAVRLSTQNSFIGLEQDTAYRSSEIVVSCPAVLYVFSDGVYEIVRPDGSVWTGDEMTAFLARLPADGTSEMDALYSQALSMRGRSTLEDDFSILKVTLRR